MSRTLFAGGVDDLCLLLGLRQITPDGFLLLLSQLLGGKLPERLLQHVHVPPFEKHQVTGRLCRRVLFQRKADAVFLRRMGKRLDVLVGDFDVGYACVSAS